MGLSRSLLCPSRAPFHGIVPGAAASSVGQISLPVTFRTQENFCTETVQFEVTDFETTYNAFLGRSALSKFMVIPHYAYLVLKMPGRCGVISIRGDVKRAFDCDRESCETADRLLASVELQELKQALAESPPPPNPVIPRPRHPSNRRTHSARRFCCPRRNLPRLLIVTPRFRETKPKPLYVYLGCSNHTYSNNMVNRYNISLNYKLKIYKITLGPERRLQSREMVEI
jgi:hypothetical protein